LVKQKSNQLQVIRPGKKGGTFAVSPFLLFKIFLSRLVQKQKRETGFDPLKNVYVHGFLFGGKQKFIKTLKILLSLAV